MTACTPPRRHVWVVEKWNEYRNTWEPCVGAELGRSNGRQALKPWQRCCPSDKFRVTRYEATR